jgi:hypothetical protein
MCEGDAVLVKRDGGLGIAIRLDNVKSQAQFSISDGMDRGSVNFPIDSSRSQFFEGVDLSVRTSESNRNGLSVMYYLPLNGYFVKRLKSGLIESYFPKIQ